jgi:hypothetical protein
VKEKPQTPAQRVANPVWLRDQIAKLVEDCEANILEDEKQATCAKSGAQEEKYLARAESHRHWKLQLERILRGKTLGEELREAVKFPSMPARTCR